MGFTEYREEAVLCEVVLSGCCRCEGFSRFVCFCVLRCEDYSVERERWRRFGSLFGVYYY